MGRRPNPLLVEFFDKRIPFPELDWATVPHAVNPWDVWDAYDDGVEGWVPVWYPTGDPVTGRSYGEFERAYFFEKDLERVLKAMHRWPLWGSARQKKKAVAIAMLHLYCEIYGHMPRV